MQWATMQLTGSFLRVSQYFHEDVTLEPETTPIDG